MTTVMIVVAAQVVREEEIPLHVMNKEDLLPGNLQVLLIFLNLLSP
jgi:hypothetical protein